MPRRTGPNLTRERILEAGLQLVDREGVGALTMRRLGRELGVEAMSLYGHVRSKQDLLDGVVERAYRELPPPPSGDLPWPQLVRQVARSLRRLLLDHPNIVTLVAERPMLSDAKLGVAEPLVAQLRRDGLDLIQASRAAMVVVAFTIGHITGEVGEQAAPGRRAGPGPARVDAARFPNVDERHRLGPLDQDAAFELGLDFVVAGISGLVGSALTTG